MSLMESTQQRPASSMALDRIVLRFVKATLTRPFENRWERHHTWTKLVLQVDADDRSGLGECAAMQTPFYSYETIETAWHVTERYLAPMLLRGGARDPVEASTLWADICGHEEAKGGLECALWDLHAQLAGRQLAVELGGSLRPVPVGATAGIEANVDEFLANIERINAAGFQRVRVKIRPGWDIEPLRAVRAAFPRLPVIADANGAYGADDLDLLSELEGLELLAIEQPFPRSLLESTVTLQSRIGTAVCLDEQIHSLQEMKNAAKLGACRQTNIKIGRVGGLAEAVRIHDFCRAEGIDVFIGGKWDLGIGRWCAAALATLPGVTLPNDIGPARLYYQDDGVDPKLELSAPGWVQPSEATGHGATLSDDAEVTRVVELSAAGCQ